MKHWSFYDKATGLFDRRRIGGPDESIVGPNTPEGYAAIEGSFDSLSQRVDIETGQVVDYQPSQPSADHEWNASSKRWQLNAIAATRKLNRESALREIARLEASQHRTMREVALGYDGAKKRLQDIDERIVRLRATLT